MIDGDHGTLAIKKVRGAIRGIRGGYKDRPKKTHVDFGGAANKNKEES